MVPGGESGMPVFDTHVPNPARIWNYWVGGKDNFAADREAADKVLEAMPAMPLIARLARRFLIDVVYQMAADYGIRQFLDIGTGLPTADNTHDVAQRTAPESRIVYVDHDPVVLSHARVLLTSSPEGETDYLLADLRDTGTILAGAARCATSWVLSAVGKPVPMSRNCLMPWSTVRLCTMSIRK